MEEAVANAFWPLRLATTTLTLFGAIGLVMAATDACRRDRHMGRLLSRVVAR
jgi:hypothetical protein